MKDEAARTPGVQVTKRPAKKSAASTAPVVVKKTMTVGDIVSMYPQTTEVMAEYGLHCFGCSANELETLEEGCLGHGFPEEDIDQLVHDLNDVIANTPPRPQTLIVTPDAGEKLSGIAKSEGKEGWGLAVIADEHGGFCLEFQEKVDTGDKVFAPSAGPRIDVFASTLTLQRIGGSTIDFRDGRFKLDVDSPKSSCGCVEGGCGCEGGNYACK